MCGPKIVRDRPELFRVVVLLDKGFQTTAPVSNLVRLYLRPYLLSPGWPAASTRFFWAFLGVKNSGTSGVAHATPPPSEASLLAPPLIDTPNA